MNPMMMHWMPFQNRMGVDERENNELVMIGRMLAISANPPLSSKRVGNTFCMGVITVLVFKGMRSHYPLLQRKCDRNDFWLVS
jgi:hypothetical protein